jgi:hypothetical protein
MYVVSWHQAITPLNLCIFVLLLLRTQELIRSPESSDWLRFSRYAPLVRKLQYNVHSETHKDLHHSVFDQIARTRLQLNILPNLHTLDWTTRNMRDLEMSVVFMHERVKRLVVWVPFYDTLASEEAEVMAVPYFREVVTRLPEINHLDLRMEIPARLIIKPITDLLSSLSSLQTIILPNFHITTPVLNTLSHLPRLGTIQFEYAPSQGAGGSLADIQPVSPTFHPGAFPALFDLSLTAALGDMHKMLEMPYAPVNLTTLFVDCGVRIMRAAEELRAFLGCVGSVCQLLEALFLDLLWMEGDSIWPAREPEERITFEALEPLLACPNLM